jgi:hypothetical protein
MLATRKVFFKLLRIYISTWIRKLLKVAAGNKVLFGEQYVDRQIRVERA